MNSIVKAGRRLFWHLCSFSVVSSAYLANAADVVWTGAAGDSNWNTPGNWDTNVVPEADPFEEVGVINNGGTAFVSSGTTPNPAGLVLGGQDGESGTVQILSGGSLTLVDSTGEPAGVANIGLGGIGTLDVRRGGSFSTTLLDVNDGSSVLIGTNAGAGFASLVSTGGMFSDGTITVKGPGHTFTAAGNVLFEPNSAYVADITAATHTKLTTPGAVGLNGTFRPQFTGISPAAGNRWDLIDSSSIDGEFALDLSAVTPATGLAYELVKVPGGTNGRLLQLQYNALLQVTINSDSKAVSISSPSGVPVNLVAYSIASAGGSLSPTTWNSLDDQNVGGANVWQEASPTANSLNELVANGTSSLSVGSSPVAIGNPYAFAPASFGQAPDVEFEYATASGELKQGFVKYTGSKAYNNLLLTVDPTTGDAQLKNSSTFPISLIGYSIVSDSGSLQPGNSDWSSLKDQGLSGWQEAAPTANALSELIASGTQTLALGPGQSYLLGDLFDNIGGSRDLQLEFLLAGDTVERLGVVAYDAIAASVLGDYNGNGIVDTADYTLWRDKLGAPAGSLANRDPSNSGVINAGDYTYWKTRFGATSGAGSGAITSAANTVPEPAASWIAVLGCVTVGSACRRRGVHAS
ncbi:MAG: hypothetical protein AB7U97_29185 [Pirellulales bacterium]